MRFVFVALTDNQIFLLYIISFLITYGLANFMVRRGKRQDGDWT
jgi:hypothetical protein